MSIWSLTARIARLVAARQEGFGRPVSSMSDEEIRAEVDAALATARTCHWLQPFPQPVLDPLAPLASDGRAIRDLSEAEMLQDIVTLLHRASDPLSTYA